MATCSSRKAGAAQRTALNINASASYSVTSSAGLANAASGTSAGTLRKSDISDVTIHYITFAIDGKNFRIGLSN